MMPGNINSRFKKGGVTAALEKLIVRESINRRLDLILVSTNFLSTWKLIAKKTNLTMAYPSSLSKTATLGAIIICVLMMMASSTDAHPIPENADDLIDQQHRVSIINQILRSDLIPGNGNITVITNNGSIINQTLPPDLIPGNGNITVIKNGFAVKILGTVRGSLPGATDTEILIVLCLWIWLFSVVYVILTILMCIGRSLCCCFV